MRSVWGKVTCVLCVPDVQPVVPHLYGQELAPSGGNLPQCQPSATTRKRAWLVGTTDQECKKDQRMAPISAFDEHKDELDHYEQMFGRERGRLAVSLDRLTNALVLVGQHGVYCTSQRNPAVPAMDLRIITQELVHAKELLQSVMEDLRRTKEA
jgi:hypothetical protein